MQSKICRTDSYAAETIANIEDLLTDILLRLPARSLLRLECVSKHWLSLISGPEFRRQHTLRDPYPKISGFYPDTIIPKVHTGIISLGDKIPSRINPPKAIYNSCYRINILQSCNGLFLCQSYPSLASIYVVNPTTNQFKDISFPHKSSGVLPFRCLYGLAFDPSESPYYTVVCLAWQEIRVYSSRTRTWKLHLDVMPGDYLLSPQYMSKHAVYCDGAINWIRSKAFPDNDTSNAFHEDNTVVYYYNLYEKFLGVSDADLDHLSNRVVYSRYFGESRGHLHLIDTYGDVITNTFDVMEMEWNYFGWFVKYRVDLNPFMALFPTRSPLWYNCDFVVLLYAVAEQEDHPTDEDTLLLHVAGKVVSYSHRTKTVTTVCELTMKDNLLVRDSSHGYMKSLACV